MLEIEIDGKKAQVPDGSTVMEAAQQVGVYIPHFCYHKKLSIAANCRMCLVEVEKAPKPLPACATPVTNGMRVFTHSPLAVKAQKGVMEFLLINHPLDCPICDQGGECQLQDLSVGYGGVSSRYKEEKRVVFHKQVGPLISMEEMSRCIHCTRCVRFGQEIAGVMELGMANRNMHSEITTFVGKTVDSELSGNMIDLCPVGALTSKPFRYSARTWELSRRKSVSPHDGLGANLIVQVKNNKVMRVLPRDNEQVNECWISDRDRFSYEGLNSDQRLTKPMIKQGNNWQAAEWNVALDYVAHGLKDIARKDGADSIGFLVSPHATFEELALVKKLAKAIGTENVDFRLRQSDFSGDASAEGAKYLGMPIADVAELDAALVVGANLRKDQPLLAQRLRTAVKKNFCKLSLIDLAADEVLTSVHARCTVKPSALAGALAAVVKVAAELKQQTVPAAVTNAVVSDEIRQIAESLVADGNKTILLGAAAQQNAAYSQIQQLAVLLGELTGAKVGYFAEAANTVGGEFLRRGSRGLNTQGMFDQARKAYVLVGAELADFANPQQAQAAFSQADMVVVMSAFQQQDALAFADAMLPIAPFTETSGTFINTEGRVQSFHGVVKPLGEARPGWKVLRVLGNVLNLAEFDYENSEQIRDEFLGVGAEFVAGLNNGVRKSADISINGAGQGLERVGDVAIYSADPIVRRSISLQATRDGKVAETVRMNARTLAAVGINAGDLVKVGQGSSSVTLTAVAEDTLPEGVVRLNAGTAASALLGPMFGAISVERA